MDPYRDVPSRECSEAARNHDCPKCKKKAGFKCVSSGGIAYNEHLTVHLDRLIAMWRNAYLSRSERELDQWHEGFEFGKSSGWEEGVLDARYTFENTLVYKGAREKDELRGLKEQVLRQMSDEGTPEEGSPSTPDDQAPHLRSVPTDSES